MLKLFVEEMYDPSAKDDNFRAYLLRNIERQQLGVMGSQKSVSPTTQAAAVNTVADLFALVKQKDSEFKPGREVSPQVLNADGTPKVFYHGTPNGTFTEFKSWQYFTDSKEYADVYQNQGASSNGYKKTADNPKTYPVYLTTQKLFDMKTGDGSLS